MDKGQKTVQPSYWAVIPAEIRYDDQIPANAKVLYAEISSLTYETGYCWADDAYFAARYRMSERTIRSLIKALADQGYIRIERDAGEHNATNERRIYAGLNPLGGSLEKNCQTERPVRKKLSGSSEKTFQTNIIYQEILTNTPIAPEKEALLRKLDPAIAQAVAAAAEKRPELLTAWLDFTETRRAKRAPIKTVRTVELLDAKLRKLSRGRAETAVRILEQSIEGSWTGLFPLKEDGAAAEDDADSYWGTDPAV